MGGASADIRKGSFTTSSHALAIDCSTSCPDFRIRTAEPGGLARGDEAGVVLVVAGAAESVRDGAIPGGKYAK